jgi:hypothetical protein
LKCFLTLINLNSVTEEKQKLLGRVEKPIKAIFTTFLLSGSI